MVPERAVSRTRLFLTLARLRERGASLSEPGEGCLMPRLAACRDGYKNANI